MVLFGAAVMIAFLSGRSAEWRPALVTAEKPTRPELRPGASVFASDGTQVGKVEWVSVDYPARIARIRFTQPRSLGIGERVLTVKGDVFTVREGNVYLTLSPTDVAALPEVHWMMRRQCCRDEIAVAEANPTVSPRHQTVAQW
jgi:hypothetical protein